MAVIDGKWHDTSCHNRLIIIQMIMMTIVMIMINNHHDHGCG